jgi:hypothetical protein
VLTRAAGFRAQENYGRCTKRGGAYVAVVIKREETVKALITVVVCLLVGAASSVAQNTDLTLAFTAQLSRQLTSDQWPERSVGFYSLVRAGLSTDSGTEFPIADGVLGVIRSNPSLRDQVVDELISLLDQETSLATSADAPDTEEYSVYYGDVIQAVSTLRDARSTHVLFRCVNTGNMALSALAGFGDGALTEALNAMLTADEETRHNLFRLFSEMTEPKNVANLTNRDSLNQLSQILMNGSEDSDPFNRLAVVPGLARLGSPSAMGALRRLATLDSYAVSSPQEIRYPVREAASKSLDDVASRIR